MFFIFHLELNIIVFALIKVSILKICTPTLGHRYNAFPLSGLKKEKKFFMQNFLDCTCHGGPGGGDAVGVVGGQEAVVPVHGGAPVGVIQVVADTLDRPG